MRRTVSGVGGDRSDAVRAARLRVEELQKRAVRLAEGVPASEEDVAEALRHAVAARARLRAALARSAEAHRSAAQVAVFAVDADAVSRHERAARVDELAIDELDRPAP